MSPPAKLNTGEINQGVRNAKDAAGFLHCRAHCCGARIFGNCHSGSRNSQDPVLHIFFAIPDQSGEPPDSADLILRKKGEHKMNHCMKALVGLIPLAPFSLASPGADRDKDDTNRLQNSGTVIQEILDIPDDIPQDLLDKARGVVVLPSVLKAAFIAGGSYGRGVMVCRTGKDFRGPWGAPAMYALEGGSFGLQAGGEATDFVILVMNGRGVDSLLHSKVKLGADASIAAGPKGRDAQAATAVTFRAEILSYSRARGVFAGVSLEGTTLRPDEDANHRLYGNDVSAAKIITEPKFETPEAGRHLVSRLQKASPQLRP